MGDLFAGVPKPVQHLHKLLKAARERNGLKPLDVSVALRLMKPGVYEQFETGVRIPGKRNLQKLAKLLSIPSADLWASVKAARTHHDDGCDVHLAEGPEEKACAACRTEFAEEAKKVEAEKAEAARNMLGRKGG